jgi:hypothetical protein
VARGVDTKKAPAIGASVTGKATDLPSHALTQAHGVSPVPTTGAGGSAQVGGPSVIGTGMNPDVKTYSVEAV